jgi:single-strand DNA-binding protein
MINRTILSGNLVSDPESRYTKTGKNITSFRIAHNETKDKTIYISVDAWDKEGETCAKVLKKGSSVIVDGRLHDDSYTNKEGQKITKLSITADRVTFAFRSEKSGSEVAIPAASSKNKAPAPQKQEEVAASGSEEGDEDIPF